MSREQRILFYILLTTFIEGSLVYGIFTLSNGLVLLDPTNLRYIERQCCYYIAYNIGYVLVFPYGMGYGNNLSGITALVIGCIGMFFAVFFIGEIIAFVKTRRWEADTKVKGNVETRITVDRSKKLKGIPETDVHHEVIKNGMTIHGPHLEPEKKKARHYSA